MLPVAITCLIVDDHAGFRAMARALLEPAGFDVVGEVADGVSALDAVDRERPDVVLLDIQLPDMSGFEVNERLRERDAHGPVVVFVSTREEREYGSRLYASGAPFIHKLDLSGAALHAAVGAR